MTHLTLALCELLELKYRYAVSANLRFGSWLMVPGHLKPRASKFIPYTVPS